MWFGVALAVAAGIELAALVLFPAGTGTFPFHWIDFAAVMLVSTLGVLVARNARGGGPLVGSTRSGGSGASCSTSCRRRSATTGRG